MPETKFVMKTDNIFLEGWLTRFCGEEMDEDQPKGWQEGYKMCDETFDMAEELGNEETITLALAGHIANGDIELFSRTNSQDDGRT